MEAKIVKPFTNIFTNGVYTNAEEEEFDFEEEDYSRFHEGDVVEILKVLSAGEYGSYESYVIFNPETKEATTISGVFLELF